MEGREQVVDKAAALFAEGFHCSQAVLAACAGLFRKEPPPAELTAAMSTFAGGMGRSGHVCGALSGALAAIGFALGKTSPKAESHQVLNRLGHDMVEEFSRITSLHGSMNCADIAAVDWDNAEAVRRFRNDPESSRKHCIHIVKETAGCLHDLVSKNFPEQRA
jgi:C_GCAxxG_C_C family probable redox protein